MDGARVVAAHRLVVVRDERVRTHHHVDLLIPHVTRQHLDRHLTLVHMSPVRNRRSVKSMEASLVAAFFTSGMLPDRLACQTPPHVLGSGDIRGGVLLSEQTGGAAPADYRHFPW